MKKWLFLFLLVLTIGSSVHSQVQRPKLVVGIVIDQMRWDYLYRYNDVFKPNGGFKRFLNQGFTCENTFIPYTPTVTAAGHTCVYTGSVPAVNGIVGNSWWDRIKNKNVYCTDDDTAKTVGSNTKAGKMSPGNMLATTIGDELRLATNFKSKVIGIALKDRASILPAGHSANAAYWYDYDTGDFITSNYYNKTGELPGWVKAFNARKLVDSLYTLNWDISLPKETYLKYATADKKDYEKRPLDSTQLGFPYDLTRFIQKDYGKIAPTPYGNVLTEAMAEAAIKAENLGKNTVTDFLAVSFSSPDYVGHDFGPNSWEQLDNYARLDQTLGKFFAFLDANVGVGNYTVFLTADHGVAHIPKFSIENKLPGGAFNEGKLIKELNSILKHNVIRDIDNYFVVFNDHYIDSAKLNKDELIAQTVEHLRKQPEIAQAFDIRYLIPTPLPAKIKERLSNGYFPSRCGDIQIILKPGYVSGNGNGTSHGLWNPYDSHIPLLWYGWGIKKGKTNRETYMTDIAPTLAALLHIQMPSGCVGDVIEEVMK